MVPAAGYHQGKINIPHAMQRLEKFIETIPGMLLRLNNAELHHKSAEDKWSKKEIFGHLVDSALNNLRRFTEVQFQPQPYKIVSYRQNELVRVNNYQDLPLDHLVQLWQSLNRQIIYVVNKIPSEKLEFKVDPQYANKEMKTFGWVIEDYVAHMDHHFQQIFPQ
ncbi:MAG: DinB family protein [Flavitalea sp.]